VAGEVAAFVELVATLRAECPWDAEQTHATLRRHLLEETYEVLDALDAVGDGGPDTDPEAYAHLEEELGDLLFQIVFHTTLATESGAFGLAEVARGIHDKLVHRHPHVFPREAEGLLDVNDAGDVVSNWEAIKKSEKGRESIFDGIPAHLPALAYALKVQKKASAVGLDVGREVPDPHDALAAAEQTPTDESIGALLQAAVALARSADIDPETALRTAAATLKTKAQSLE
jgi:tetrapyrrole methylase family protein/MazG family protein